MAPASVDALHATLPCVAVLSPALAAGSTHLFFDSLAACGHPPACGDLARLRTIVLLA